MKNCLLYTSDVVGAQDGVNVEVAAVLSLGQAGDLIGGDVLDELCLTAVCLLYTSYRPPCTSGPGMPGPYKAVQRQMGKRGR